MTLTTKESLDHFRTVAFGLEVMRKMIGRSRDNISSVDAAAWFEGMVPKCYRPAVTACMQRVLARHLGKKLTDGAVYELVVDLNAEIYRTVEPIMPGENEIEPFIRERANAVPETCSQCGAIVLGHQACPAGSATTRTRHAYPVPTQGVRK